MRRTLKLVVVLLALLGLLTSCKKKQPAVPPPQAQAPTITTIPQPEQPEPLPPPFTEPKTAEETKPKPKPSRKKIRKKAAPKAEPPKKIVVRDGGTSAGTAEPGPQLSTGLPQGEAIQQRQNAAELLAVAESNLRSLNWTLSPEEQSMLQQIHAYMDQSRSAATSGDTERAYNLALKARLLSDELVKR